MVPFSSSKTFVFISWQLTQNFSVFVASRTVLNPPQKNTPATNPPSVRKARLSVLAGVNACRTSRPIQDFPTHEFPKRARTASILSPPSLGLREGVHIGEP